MKIEIPEPALVVLVGASGSGKTTFAHAHFKPTEIISSDRCRALVADDEADQSATKDAFEVVHLIAAKRLARGRLTVIDATSVQFEARRPLLALAREYQVPPVAIVFSLPEAVVQERNLQRAQRQVISHVIGEQHENLRRSLKGLEREGFARVYVLWSPDEIASVKIERLPLSPLPP